MTEIYIVLVEDRHADVDALPYTTSEVAVARAEQLLAQFARHPEDVERDLNAAMVDDGWVWNARYSEEGDSISVIRRELNGSR